MAWCPCVVCAWVVCATVLRGGLSARIGLSVGQEGGVLFVDSNANAALTDVTITNVTAMSTGGVVRCCPLRGEGGWGSCVLRSGAVEVQRRQPRLAVCGMAATRYTLQALSCRFLLRRQPHPRL